MGTSGVVDVRYNICSVGETLRHLGLPPNPTGYDPGSKVRKTDGKLRTEVV